jgi:hypothetical protein
MKMCGLSVSDSNFGIQWHIVAMYGPSFFTGSLIARFGAPAIVALGLVLEAAAATIGLSGITALHFWATLIVLGAGWNLAFIGASALVLETHHRGAGKNGVVSVGCWLLPPVFPGSGGTWGLRRLSCRFLLWPDRSLVWLVLFRLTVLVIFGKVRLALGPLRNRRLNLLTANPFSPANYERGHISHPTMAALLTQSG